MSVVVFICSMTSANCHMPCVCVCVCAYVCAELRRVLASLQEAEAITALTVEQLQAKYVL